MRTRLYGGVAGRDREVPPMPITFDNRGTQGYNCLLIPPFDNNQNLPPGIYTCTLAEIEARFANNEHRRPLFEQLMRTLETLKEANCSEVYLNGSFITAE